MKDGALNILTYNDYRKFLNEHFDHRKSKDRNFTYGRWAKEIGLSSISGLTMILAGQRHAGKSICELLIKNLQLNEEESAHFLKLVKLQKQTKDNPDLVVYMMDNLKLEENVDDTNRPLQFRWQMGFIREAIKWSDFKTDDDWIKNKSRFEVDSGLFSDILSQMLEEKMLKKIDQKIIVNKEYSAQALDTRYFQYLHKEFLRMIDQSYHFPSELRMLEYRLIMIDKSKVAQAKAKLNKLLNEFIDEFDISKSTSELSEVYLTSLHLTPLSKL